MSRLLSTSRALIGSLGRRPVQTLQSRSFASAAGTPAQLKKTALHPLHVELSGKMVEFAGWDMPIQYSGLGIVDSHLHTRKFTGKDRVKFIEKLVIGDIQSLPEGHARLSAFTNEQGGIIDDTVITNRGSHLYIVVNAGCAHKDIPHIKKHLDAFKSQGGDATMEQIHRSLIALQGPAAESVLQKLVGEDISKMPFMTSKEMQVDSVKGVLVSRCGYTGEDGFELSVDNGNAISLAKRLLSFPEVKPAGLGARDTLRLEAGLCLYGHDLEENISPIEAGLAWCIGKRRREQGGFLGSDKILGQLAGKIPVTQKRVGMFVDGPPARENTPVFSGGAQVGNITSGTFSPVLKKAIAMAYVKSDLTAPGTALSVKVRGKEYPAAITKMPFVPTSYKKV